MSIRVRARRAPRLFHDERLVEAGSNRIRLAIDFLALDAIEGASGLKMPEIVRAMLSGSCPLNVSAKVLWGLLLRHHQATVEEAAGLMFGEHRAAINDAISGLFEEAFNLGPSEKSDKGSKIEWSIKAFLVEWVRLGGSPSEFTRQTPRSYVAIMEGMAAAATRKLDLCIVTAWHTAVFALSGYSGKLKPLSEFLSSKPEPEEVDERMQNAQAIHFFQSLKARGVPIEISRTTH
jgi:hypothetical protein